ncbi:hypothetical protein Q1695_000441 [Nippostrongylus brasiliensis]|nr:hypothetical protein Q1695_000441 [Nippostrongylus brasiliensis]
MKMYLTPSWGTLRVAHLQEEISAARRQDRDIRAQHEYLSSVQAHHREELTKTVENNRKILSSVDEIIRTSTHNYAHLREFCRHLW